MFNKSIVRKLKSNKGETLVEALAAILIIALASLLLIGSVSSAVNINKRVKQEDKNFKTDVAAAEQQQATLDKANKTLTIGDKTFTITYNLNQ